MQFIQRWVWIWYLISQQTQKLFILSSWLLHDLLLRQPKICFPVEVPEDQLYLTPASQEHAAQIQENKSEFFATLLSIGKVRRLHEDHKREFKEKSDKYKELLDLAEPFVKRLHGHSSMSSKKVGSFSILSLPDFVNWNVSAAWDGSWYG